MSATVGDKRPLTDWRLQGSAAEVRGVRERLERHHGWVALAVYVAIAMFWDRQVVAHMQSMCPCKLPGDPSTYLWTFGWYPHALLNGLVPFYSHAAYAPSGVNLAASVTVPFIATVMAPVTWLWGPIASFNVVSVAAPALNAWAAYRLCRYVSHAPWASLLAGATYGFGAYETAQLQGHMHLFVMVVPPLAALCALKFLNGELSKRRFGVFMTALFTAQLFISTEVLFTMSVLGAVALLLGWIFATRSYRDRIVSMLVPLALAYVATFALASYYLYWMLKMPPVAQGVGLRYRTDLLSFIVPEPFTWIGGSRLTGITSTFSDVQSETNAYLGIPLILIVVAYLSTHWTQRSSRFLASLLAVAVLWVLGGHLYVAGKPTIWLPYSLFENLPLFNEVMQGRIAVFVELACAVVLALWLASPSRHVALRWVGGLVALALVMPNLLHLNRQNVGTWTNPAFFRTDTYKRYIRPGAEILPIRWFGMLNESEMWQAEDGFYWNLADGYFTVLPKGWAPSRIQDSLRNDAPRPGDGPRLRSYLEQHHVSDVVVVHSQIGKWSRTLRDAGLRPIKIGGIFLYRVPGGSSATA